ncbi:hypothetical protein H5410_050386 [Solanum commersonii]|uniref:G-patch domain-containing protein n=1 Tax=Solanum commersonii TaxID=4109 RepID=A0A9J5WWN3_SOLCO|nr:hypothetical protein H5410_050386 [Solanum commersonii]
MIFPKKRDCVNFNLLPMVIYMFRGPVRVTIVPMILAEIFQSLSLCSRGYDHFRGNNLFLQVHGRALLRTNHIYFIELIGLEGFQPYAPLRVLQQFGITQDVPLWSNMALLEVTPRSVDHLIQAVDNEPEEKMEEDPEEDLREPTEEMEKDPEEHSENDPNLTTQHAPVDNRVPPAFPAAVKTNPDLSNHDPTISTMMQILVPHVVVPYEPHVPHVYVAGAPTFTILVVVNVSHEVDQYAEMVKYARLKEDASINAQLHVRNACAYTPIAKPYAQLFEWLRIVGVLQPVEEKLPDLNHCNFNGYKRCAYHLGIQGHDTEDCYGLKDQIEYLIKKTVIKCTLIPPNVNNSPLSNHKNREVNMITLDEEYKVTHNPNIDEADAMTSLAQPVITVQLSEPLSVQKYLPRVVVTTLIIRNHEQSHFSHFKNYASCKGNEEVDPDDTKLSSAAKMVASEMLKYGYQPKSGLGPKFNGIVEPTQLKHQRGINRLKYESTLRRVHHGSSKTIFVLENDLIPDQAGNDNIVEGIGNLFVAMIGEEEEINLSKLTIRDAELGEIL